MQNKEFDFKNVWEFYPYYLTEHSNPTCRVLHFIGTSIALMIGVYSLLAQTHSYLLIGVIQGYAFAWVGHFFFEQNKPATFRYPIWSFMCDWIMWWNMLNGQVEKQLEKAMKKYKPNRRM